MSVSVEDKCVQLWKLLKEKAPALRPKIIVRGYDDDQLAALCRSEVQREALEESLDRFASSQRGKTCTCCGEGISEDGGTFSSEWDFDFDKKRQILSKLSYLCETCYSLSDLEEFLPKLAKPNADVLAQIAQFHTVNGIASSDLPPVALVDYIEQCYSIAFSLNIILANFPSWSLVDLEQAPFSDKTDFKALVSRCLSHAKKPSNTVTATPSKTTAPATPTKASKPKVPKSHSFEIDTTPRKSDNQTKRKNERSAEKIAPGAKRAKA